MLSGIRVLDLSRVLAGPLCTMMLGDLGADILKVERPGTGDDTRGWGPPFDERGESAYFLSVNRNKLSVAADLASTADRELVGRLIDGADVVVENFLPGALSRLGLDVARFRAARPSLIWCTISGFGPGSTRPGYDFVVQAEQGWMAITGEPAGPPLKVGVALADVVTGKDAAIAILSALVARGRTGVGHHIHVSLQASATAALINVGQNVLVGREDARRWGNGHPNLVPYQLFRAADRDLVIAVGNDGQWRVLVAALDIPDLATPALATNRGRLAARAAIVAALERRLAERPAEAWIELLQGAGVPCGLVRTVEEVMQEAGASPLHGIAPSVPGSVRRPPPRLDEHGALIRTRGWDAFGAL